MFRRRTLDVDRSALALVLTIDLGGGTAAAAHVRAGGLLPDALTVPLSAVGLTIVVVGKLTLGRSFGIVPANRGIVTRGPYRVRAPSDLSGYLITHLAFLAAHPSLRNAIILLIADVALVARALKRRADAGERRSLSGVCRRVGMASGAGRVLRPVWLSR